MVRTYSYVEYVVVPTDPVAMFVQLHLLGVPLLKFV